MQNAHNKWKKCFDSWMHISIAIKKGNDKIKVLAVYQNQPAHRVMTVIEASTYEDVSVFTNQFKDIGSCEVQLVGDGIAGRHASGNWGK